MNCQEIQDYSPLYLSGELPDETYRAFGAHLAACRNCAQELQRQIAMDGQLRAALTGDDGLTGDDALDTAALDLSVRNRIAASSLRAWRFRLATAAAFVFVAGLAGYLLLRPATIPRALADAARDHRAEATEHQPRRWRTNVTEIDTLTKRYGLTGSDAAALAPAGYHLEHAKTCGIAGAPALHLVYTNGAREVSMYVRRNQAGDSSDLRQAVVGVEYVESLHTSRYTALIVTEGSRGDCLPFERSAVTVL